MYLLYHTSKQNASITSKGRRPGFTIVELLIVIVVIAILAALSYVAYTSISNRAHDTAIKSDLAIAAKQIKLFRAERGVVPTASATNAPSGILRIGIKPTKESYGEGHIGPTGGSNFTYCRSADGTDFSMVSWSKSGNAFVFIDDTISEYTYPSHFAHTTCPRTGISNGGYYNLYHGSVWLV